MKKGIPWLFLLFILFIVMRLLYLRSDAPDNLGDGRAPFTDEAFWAHNAFNKVNFGNWIKDEFNYMYLSPVYNLMIYSVFNNFGISYFNLRLISVFFSILSLIIFWLIIRRNISSEFSLVGLIFLGFNYIFIVYNRLGLIETTLIFFLLLSLYFFIKGQDNNIFFAFSGVFSCIGYILKSSSGIFPLVLLTVLIYLFREELKQKIYKKFFYTSGYLIGGFGAVLIVYLLVYFIPNYQSITYLTTAYLAKWGLPHSFNNLLRNIQRFWAIPIFVKMPLISFGSIIGFYICGKKLLKRENIPILDILSWFWIIIGVLFLSFFSYHSIRYCLYLIPPFIILSVSALDKIYNGKIIEITYKKNKFFSLICFIVSFFIIRYAFIYYLRDIILKSFITKFISDLSIFILTTGLFLLIKFLFETNNLRVRQKFVRVFISLFLIYNISVYSLTVIKNPSYQVSKISKKIGKEYPNAVIGGPWAPALCLENGLQAIPIMPDYVNYRDTFKKFPITHLLLEDRDEELRFIKQEYPDVAMSLRLIDKFSIDKYEIGFYKLNK